MDKYSALIEYFKSCYEIDAKSISVTNFYNKKVENRLVVEGTDELLNGNMLYHPVSDEYGEGVQWNLSTYDREKKFYTFSHFVIGYIGGYRMCAPLCLIPSEIVKSGEFYYVKADFSQKFMNYGFLNRFRKEGAKSIEELFQDVMNKEFLGFAEAAQMQRILEENFEDLNSDGLLLYPELFSEKKIKATRPKKTFKIVPSVSFGIVRISEKSLGVVSELDELMSQSTSSLMKDFFGEKQPFSRGVNEEVFTPSILNAAQQKAIENLSKNKMSVIVGPPGTGKSFTIANIALNEMQKGKSVLIVSKTDAAVDVVLEKITALGFGETAIRAGNKMYLFDLRDRIQNLIWRNFRTKRDAEIKDTDRFLTFEKAQLESLENQFLERIGQELKWGEFIAENRDVKKLMTAIKKKYINWKNKSKVPHWKMAEKYYNNQNGYLESASEHIKDKYLHQLKVTILKNSDGFKAFLKGLKARRLVEREKAFNEVDFGRLLEALPIWLCNLSGLNDGLPLKKEMFDVVIVDEASQCDIATAIPALHRAKQLIVVGDPNQLRHFSFVSGKQQKVLSDKLSIDSSFLNYLDYRNSSLLDVCMESCARNSQMTFLDEHFRGNAQLFAFSNKEFYQGQLKMMKSLPMHQYNSVEFKVCEGVRDKDGVNEIELNAVLNMVQQIMQQESKKRDKTSIGIMSPFRKQVDQIKEIAWEKLNRKRWVNHNIKIGTPHDFQGNERDLMMLSWCIDDETPASAKAYLDKREMFNVATTRARVKSINFCSFSREKLKPNSLLRGYCDTMREYEEVSRIEEIYSDNLLNEVSAFLSSQKIKYRLDFSVAGISVDILLELNNKKYKAIDLIGYPGKFYGSIDLHEYLMLDRAGISVFPLPYTYWYFDKEAVKKELLEYITN